MALREAHCADAKLAFRRANNLAEITSSVGQDAEASHLVERLRARRSGKERSRAREGRESLVGMGFSSAETQQALGQPKTHLFRGIPGAEIAL